MRVELAYFVAGMASVYIGQIVLQLIRNHRR